MSERTKSELLANIKEARAALDAAVERAGDRLEEPGLDGGWSVKDTLAHISAWEKIGMATVRNNQPVQAPEPGESTTNITDTVNQKIYESNHDRPLAEVRVEAERSYANLLALVEGLSDEAIDGVLGGADEGPTAAQILSGNSDGHYREHAEYIARWLDGG